MKFEKIVSVDNTGLTPDVKNEIEKLANEVIWYDDYPKENSELISRIGEADCVLVSWNTPIRAEVINACPNIKYIGMCCSLIDENSANVDVRTAKEKGITVLGVRDYGDEGVVEYIISELVRLLHGFGEHQWKSEDLELTNQKLGIIGMGTLGKMLAERAQSFGMQVFYYSRSRKPEVEKKSIEYLELSQLLKKCDIITTHLPRNTVVLGANEFKNLGNNKIIVNTSLEPTFDVEEFAKWIKQDGNYAIFDKVAMGKYYDTLKSYNKVIYTNKVTGFTYQAKGRLSNKVLKNIESFITQKGLVRKECTYGKQ